MANLDIVTVYNNIDMMSEMVESAKATAGNIEINIIAIDNRNNKFSSASKAYNYALSNMCKSECIMFCHQDIIFFDGAIENYYKHCTANENCLFGAAGVLEDKKSGRLIISNMQQQRGGSRYDSLPEGGEKSVFTMDECLIAAHKNVFRKVRFDENVCDNWHLYAVDLCLQCHLEGIDVKVIDSNICHLSGGNVNKAFYCGEKRLAKKYRNDYEIIKYTWGWAYTNPLRFFVQRTYRFFRYKLWKLK